MFIRKCIPINKFLYFSNGRNVFREKHALEEQKQKYFKRTKKGFKILIEKRHEALDSEHGKKLRERNVRLEIREFLARGLFFLLGVFRNDVTLKAPNK